MQQNGIVLSACNLIGLSIGLFLGPAAALDTARVDFSRDVRPLLSDRCFQCHGPDKEHRKADLRLDVKAGAFADLGGYGAIVPGNPAASELMKRITAADPDERMPPASSGIRPLTAKEVALIRRWIDSGARWEEHWAFTPPKRPALPAVKDAAWPLHPLDFFVLQRLEKAGLRPSAEADRRTLIRRVTLDLIGLPPTWAEVEAFVEDTAPNAYERVVERLLESEHYGEHQARYWLDAARYGDTHGLHLDNYREMWPYRDWVIRAFNNNMSFAQFATEQLAGDLLPEATIDQRVASGFNRCHVTTGEGGSIAEEVYVRNVVDRVETAGTVFMGLTIGCCVCHDHKFDPVTQKEFYQLFAFFNNLDGSPLDGNKKDHAPALRVPTREGLEAIAQTGRRIADIEKRLRDPQEKWDQEQAEWEETLLKKPATPPAWEILDPDAYRSSGGATFKKLPDKSLLAGGKNAPKDVYEIAASVKGRGQKWRSVRLEGLRDDTLPHKGTGRSENSNVVLTEFELEVAPATRPNSFQRVKLASAWADHEQGDGNFKVANAIDGNVATGWATDGHRRRENRTAVFIAGEPFGFEAGTRVRVRLRHESIYARHQFGRVRLALSTAATVSEKSGVPADVLSIVRSPRDRRSDAQAAKLRDYFRASVSSDGELKKLRATLASARKRRGDIERAFPTSLVMKERAQARDAFVLVRGQYDRRGDKVGREVPAVLPPMQEDLPRNRLGLARWLVDPAHPLTARVAVNRFWQQHFGLGLVRTAEDFGNQGERPSHPELLDWLALWFVEHNWDVKALHRLIVTSATYRQTSRMTPEGLAKDPENRLLGRGARFRLDAEVLRDQALAVSGLLVRKIGGPSVKPPQPAGLWYAVGYTGSNTARFKADSGERIYRRSLYTFWKRTAPAPQMRTFDAPSRESCIVRRERTNTPLQALLLMNDPQYVEAARHLAEETMRKGGKTVGERCDAMFQRVTLRPPAPAILREMVDAYEDFAAEYAKAPEAAKALIHVGASKPDARWNPVELAAWTMVANVVLNLDEVITKE